MLKRLVMALALAFGALGLAACDSLPQDVERSADRLDDDIEALHETLDRNKNNYEAAKAKSDWSFYAPYAQRENWDAQPAEAREEIAALRAMYDARVQKFISADRSEDAAATRVAITAVRDEYNRTLETVNFIPDRMAILLKGKNNASRWVQEGRTTAATVAQTVEAIQPVRAATKQQFPGRADDIDARYAPVDRIATSVENSLETLNEEFAKHDNGGNADYAKFADAYTTIMNGKSAMEKADKSYRDQLASLSREYSLILRDMKIEYRAVVGRSTWNSASDYGEQSLTYEPSAISKADYDYLAGSNRQEKLARRYSSWGDWKQDINIDRSVWNSLNVDMDARWPDRSHDDSVFYIEDLYPVYFFKYDEVNGSTVTSRDWEEVDAAEFGARADDFGMAVETKRLGQFADEAITDAIPPGADMVGDPRYGRWESDGQGGQRWSFLETYAMYHLLFGGNDRYYYSRADYDSYRGWRDDRRSGGGTYGWYGRNRSQPTFGSNGSRTRNTSTFRASPYRQVGGAAAVPRSARTAGANFRSRGPGGRGK